MPGDGEASEDKSHICACLDGVTEDLDQSGLALPNVSLAAAWVTSLVGRKGSVIEAFTLR